MRFLQFLIIILLIGCSFNNERSVKDHSMYWHKNSAEYKALCLQAYNIAKKKLEQELSKDYEKPLAIIADLDETILDNTPYNEMLIKENKSDKPTIDPAVQGLMDDGVYTKEEANQILNGGLETVIG